MRNLTLNDIKIGMNVNYEGKKYCLYKRDKSDNFIYIRHLDTKNTCGHYPDNNGIYEKVFIEESNFYTDILSDLDWTTTDTVSGLRKGDFIKVINLNEERIIDKIAEYDNTVRTENGDWFEVKDIKVKNKPDQNKIEGFQTFEI